MSFLLTLIILGLRLKLFMDKIIELKFNSLQDIFKSLSEHDSGKKEIDTTFLENYFQTVPVDKSSYTL